MQHSPDDVTPTSGPLDSVASVLADVEERFPVLRSIKVHRQVELESEHEHEGDSEELPQVSPRIRSRNPAKDEDRAFTLRPMLQASIPRIHRVGKTEVRRQIDGWTIVLYSPDGLPSGAVPRLVLSWLATRATITKQREIPLGAHFTRFLERDLEFADRGGKKGSRQAVKRQLEALSKTAFFWWKTSDQGAKGGNRLIADDYAFWWDEGRDPDEAPVVILSEHFFQEVQRSPVPVRHSALRQLARSPLAMDLYTLCTYSFHGLREPMLYSWGQLHEQFGPEYKQVRDFRRDVRQALRHVKEIYPEAHVLSARPGLVLKPSPTHVPPLKALPS
jgi:hypothetical protein